MTLVKRSVKGSALTAAEHDANLDHVLSMDNMADGSTNVAMLATERTKLAGVEASADVTDTANVTSAGALMDSEVTSLSGIKTLTVPDNTTISTFGASITDDADASAARTTLELANVKTSSIQFVIDGNGSAITTGIKGDIEVPVPCTITEARVLADQTGSIVVDIWKDTYANFPPTDADSITASAPPTLSSAAASSDTTLTGWTTSIAAEDVLRFNVDSATTVTRVTVALKVSIT